MNPRFRNIFLLVVMLLAAALAVVLKPTRLVSESAQHLGYEQMIPHQFADWTAETDNSSLVINPQQDAQLQSLYSEVVTRTYVQKASGRKIMLSIAYGADQTHENQVHKPEVCYPAQGFELLSSHKDQVHADSGEIPVMRVLTRHGQRVEPVTYWIRIGDKVVRGAVEQNLARVQFGLRGHIPDGLLFRVSSIENDSERAYQFQDAFVNDLMNALSPDVQAKLVGQVLPTKPPRVNSLSESKDLKG